MRKIHSFFLFFAVIATAWASPPCDYILEDFDFRYKCLEGYHQPIGQGSNGVAHVIEEKSTGEKRVLKISNLRGQEVEPKANQIVHDKLGNSKYIIKRYEMRIKGNFMFEVLEYAINGSLIDYMNNYNLKGDQRATLRLFLSIVKGVEELHKNNIVHADLKPGNIVIDVHNEPKIIDFDLSVQMGSRAKPRGTSAYMSPEILGSNTYVVYDEKVDVWALGVTLYSMLYYDLPFAGTSRCKILESIQNDKLRIKPKTSFDIARILVSMLRYEPEKRVGISEISDTIMYLLYKPNWNYIIKAKEVTTSIHNLKYTCNVYLKDSLGISEEVDNCPNLESRLSTPSQVAPSVMSAKEKVLVFTSMCLMLFVLLQLIFLIIYSSYDHSNQDYWSKEERESDIC